MYFFITEKSIVPKHFVNSTVSLPMPKNVTQNAVIYDNSANIFSLF